MQIKRKDVEESGTSKEVATFKCTVATGKDKKDEDKAEQQTAKEVVLSAQEISKTI